MYGLAGVEAEQNADRIAAREYQLHQIEKSGRLSVGTPAGGAGSANAARTQAIDNAATSIIPPKRLIYVAPRLDFATH